MRELELDGIHDDGEQVILVDSDGERYTLRIDKALRAAVRSDRPALNMIQAAGTTALRPREIQAMLRAGRSAEDISEDSDIPLEHVRRYEGPVLAEREWTAQRARTFPVGRGGPALESVVGERLAAREATGDTAWDAWRRQDGTWTLELTFSAGGRTRQAHWVADIDNRSISPIDDEARWISDEDAPPEPSRGRGRLQAVRSAVYDLEADGSLEGSPAVPRRGRPWPAQSSASEAPGATIEDHELDALNARRGLRSVPRPDDSATVWTSLDEALEADASAPTAPTPPSPSEDEQAPAPGTPAEQTEDPDLDAQLEHSREVEAAPRPEESDVEQPGPEAAAPEDGDGEEPDAAQAPPAAQEPIQYQDTVDLTPLPGFGEGAGPASATPEEPEKPARKPARSKNRRASMPTWDEIVFGSKPE